MGVSVLFFRGLGQSVAAVVLASAALVGCGRTTNAPRALLDAPQNPLQASWQDFCRAPVIKPGLFILSYPLDTPQNEVDRVLAEMSGAGFQADVELRRAGRSEVEQPVSWGGVVTDAVSQTIQTRILAVRLPAQATLRCAGLDAPDLSSGSTEE